MRPGTSAPPAISSRNRSRSALDLLLERLKPENWESELELKLPGPICSDHDSESESELELVLTDLTGLSRSPRADESD